MTSIERTAYPQFRRLTTARVLHVFFSPTEDEVAWARERTESLLRTLAAPSSTAVTRERLPRCVSRGESLVEGDHELTSKDNVLIVNGPTGPTAPSAVREIA